MIPRDFPTCNRAWRAVYGAHIQFLWGLSLVWWMFAFKVWNWSSTCFFNSSSEHRIQFHEYIHFLSIHYMPFYTTHIVLKSPPCIKLVTPAIPGSVMSNFQYAAWSYKSGVALLGKTPTSHIRMQIKNKQAAHYKCHGNSADDILVIDISLVFCWTESNGSLKREEKVIMKIMTSQWLLKQMQ